MPSSFKLRNGRGKAIFQAALRDVVPEFVTRRPKRGFELPVLRWLRGPLQERAQAAFASGTARQLFDAAFLRRARSKLRALGSRDTRLWGYFVLLAWLSDRQIEI